MKVFKPKNTTTIKEDQFFALPKLGVKRMMQRQFNFLCLFLLLESEQRSNAHISQDPKYLEISFRCQ